MRTYFEKSRTLGGWKGLLYDPHLNGTNDISYGLKTTRSLLLELAARQIPTAAEILEPCTVPYVADLLSWSCIGARTVTSQIHRQLASGLSMPVAFKNSVDGNIDHAIQGAVVASQPHCYLGIDSQGYVSTVTTKGNPHPHITLRGSNQGANSDIASIEHALTQLHQFGLPQQLLIDCSHGNSQRQSNLQPKVLYHLLELIEQGFSSIRGVIIESHLYSGQQPLTGQELTYGISITDPCLGWDETEQLLLTAHQRLHYHSQGNFTVAIPRVDNHDIFSLPIASP
jgi:3-deoxy-7-phosphoheptulonate synthase